MRILFLTTKSPLPANDGHSLRSFNLLKQLAKENEIHLLSFVKFREEYHFESKLKDLCRSVRFLSVPENDSRLAMVKTLVKSAVTKRPYVLYKYDRPEMRQAIQEALKTQMDIIHLDMLPLTVYLDMLSSQNVVLDEHNVESFLLRRLLESVSDPIKRYFISRQQIGLENFERTIVSQVGLILTCSSQDKAILQGFAPSTPVHIVPNGVDVDFFYPADPRKKENNKIVFVGGLNWYPNKDGIQWFDREVMPAILEHGCHVTVEIIGRRAKIKWIHSRHFRMLGYVDDVRPYMEKAAVFIVPLRIGGGTRLKILNAMAMEGAIVSTSIGAEGLGASNGKNIMIADDSREFARNVVNLLKNPDRAMEIGKNARIFICANYDWSMIGTKLNKIYQQLIQGPSAHK